LSVVIQDFEFHQAQLQKQKDEESVKESAQKLADITTQSSTILGTTTQTTKNLGTVQGDLKGSLDSQRKMLTQITSSAETLSGVAQPIVPATFRVSLHYDIAPGSCLVGFGETVRSAVNGRTAPQDADTPPEVVDNPATGASHIAFKNTSPVYRAIKGQQLLQRDMWVRFHRKAPGIQFGSGATQNDGIEYILDFALDSANESQEVDNWKGYLPVFHASENFVVSYIKGTPKAIDFDWEGVNIYNNNDAPVFRAASELPGTVLELALGDGCAGRPRLNDFEMAWGPNYSYSSDFDTSKFSVSNSSAGATSFVYYPKKGDFHFGLY
jgi:hypothetical protein